MKMKNNINSNNMCICWTTVQCSATDFDTKKSDKICVAVQSLYTQ